MPNSTPAPRRASGAKRPSNPGRPAAGGRSGASRGSSYDRTPRDGAERRISRSAAPRRDRDERGAAMDRPGRPAGERSFAPRRPREAGDRDPRPFADRAPRRYDREDISDERRPRPSAAARGASRGAPSRGASASRGGDKTGRPGRPVTGGRNEKDTRSYGRDRRDLNSNRFDPKPRTKRTARPVREVSPEELEKQRASEFGRQQGWGGVARKGGMNISSVGQAMDQTPTAGVNPDPLGEWVEEARPQRSAAPTKAKAKPKYALPGDIAAEVRKAFIGTSYMREKMVITFTKAAEGYDRKRWEEALRLGRIVSDAVPGVAEVRELTGLAAYKAERWNMAKIHLRAHFAITGDPEHLPLVMDCDRANRRFRAVEKTFKEIAEADANADTLAESRIVMASTLADQNKYTEAIDILLRAGASKILRNPAYRHVRLWYTLGDIYDRAGDQVSAREFFSRVVNADQDAYDAKDRLTELGAVAVVRKNRKRRTASVSKKKVD